MFGVPEIADIAIYGIIGQVLQPIAFDELRTKQQLGYVVSGGVGMVSNVLFASVNVQGDVKLPDEIEPQIEMVLTKMVTEKLQKMTDDEFETYKASYLKELLEPPLGFTDEIEHYWPMVARGGRCPDKHLEIVQYVQESFQDKEVLLKAWKNKVLPEDGSRTKITVKYFSDKMNVPPRLPAEKLNAELLKLDVPKRALELVQTEYKSAVVL